MNKAGELMIYADNAATTKLDEDAFEAMKTYLAIEYANVSQPYSFAKSAKSALKRSREVVAACIGAEPEEIYFTSGGTESDNWAIKSVLHLKNRNKHIVTSQIEHHAVLNACRSLEGFGVSTNFLPVDRDGELSPKTLEGALKKDAALVSVMLANNEIGTIEPIRELSGIAHEHKAVFHTDAVQAVGHVPINVKKLGVDMLSASAHKFNGMKGSGFLYVRNGIDIHPYLDGGAQERGQRAGTENIASIVAMATALRKNCDRMENTIVQLRNLENIFLSRLSQGRLDYVRNGSSNHLPGNINISIRGADGEMLLHRLDLKEICISTGSACDSVNTQVSHVIKAIQVPAPYAEGTIRITFGVDNTEKEAVAIAEAILHILESQ